MPGFSSCGARERPHCFPGAVEKAPHVPPAWGRAERPQPGPDLVRMRDEQHPTLPPLLSCHRRHFPDVENAPGHRRPPDVAETVEMLARIRLHAQRFRRIFGSSDPTAGTSDSGDRVFRGAAWTAKNQSGNAAGAPARPRTSNRHPRPLNADWTRLMESLKRGPARRAALPERPGPAAGSPPR